MLAPLRHSALLNSVEQGCVACWLNCLRFARGAESCTVVDVGRLFPFGVKVRKPFEVASIGENFFLGSLFVL